MKRKMKYAVIVEGKPKKCASCDNCGCEWQGEEEYNLICILTGKRIADGEKRSELCPIRAVYIDKRKENRRNRREKRGKSEGF